MLVRAIYCLCTEVHRYKELSSVSSLGSTTDPAKDSKPYPPEQGVFLVTSYGWQILVEFGETAYV